jgi:hypothetical protein
MQCVCRCLLLQSMAVFNDIFLRSGDEKFRTIEDICNDDDVDDDLIPPSIIIVLDDNNSNDKIVIME